MQLECPACHRVLEFSGERPSFCASCGQALGKPKPGSTVDYDPEAATLPPSEQPTDEPQAIPEVVGGYRLLRSLGTGGMGTVYEAEESTSGRRVALKLISPEFATSTDAVNRFRQEGKLASLIAHPRCVFVLAADEEAGRPYIVMELMPGATLEDLVKERGPLPPEEAVAKILDVIEGVQEAHRLGVIHRDIKPSNCFLEANGRVKIGDFGVAKSLLRDAQLTKLGAIVGTPLYASPEQVKAQPVDKRSDVYSVAATFYFLLTSQAPHQTGDAAATLARIASDPAPSMRRLRPELLPALDQVVLRGLERQRERRWPNLQEFRAALLPFLPGQLSIGGMGMRLGAYFIDGALLMLFWVSTVVFLALLAEDTETTSFVQAQLIPTYVYVHLPTYILYFTILEGVWGCSLGKRWLRLRVCTALDNSPPGLARALWRSLLFYGVVFGAYDWIRLSPLMGARAGMKWDFLLALAALVVGFLLLAATMRARNGYRGLHEFLSGTRVVQLPWPEKRRTFPTDRSDRDLLPPEGLPEQLGPFVIRGVYPGSTPRRLCLGEDVALGRKVWIWLRPLSDPPLSAARQEIGRTTRPRWLAGGQHADLRWDAFVALEGASLVDLVRDSGPLPWREVRPLLEQLTDELVAACTDLTLPRTLSIVQVWVRPDGRLLLLDTPLDGSPWTDPEQADTTGQEKAFALLRQLAVLTLEGRSRPLGQPPSSIRAPLPEHASLWLGQLFGAQQPERTLEQVQADLAAIHHRPTEVSRGVRAGHLALLGAFLSVGLTLMFQAAYELMKSPSHLARDLGPLMLFGISPVIWVIWAYLWRGGFSFRLMGLTLVRSDGQRVSRLQCAWRALLIWAPVTGLLLLSVWLSFQYPDWQQREDFGLVQLLIWGSYLSALALLPVYILLALLFPTRSLHDRLAGTYLVPR
jgi:uncharacterized RDD family membrane protein YckC